MSDHSRFHTLLLRSARVAVPTAAVLGVGTAAYAAAAQHGKVTNPTIHACVTAKGARKGALRIATKCAKGETTLTWTKTGLAGPRGLVGLPGASGAGGAAGGAGASGRDGIDASAPAPGPVCTDMSTSSAPLPAPTGPTRDLFLNLGSSLRGDSVDSKHSHEIDIQSFCFGNRNGHLDGTITFQTSIDRSFSPLLQAMATGAELPASAEVSIATATQSDIATLTLEHPHVAAMRLGGHGTALAEDLTLTFTQAHESVIPSGGGTSVPVDFTPTAAPDARRPKPACLGVDSTGANASGVDMFLSIPTPGILGESTDSKHANQIDVTSFCFGGSTDSAGAPSYTDLTIDKHLDRSTPKLIDALQNDTPVTAQLQVVKAGATPAQILQLTLNDARVSSYREGGRVDATTEDIAFAWTSMTVAANAIDSKGATTPLPSVSLTR